MIYRSILRPILFQLSPEAAHELALGSLASILRARWIRNVVAARYQTSSCGPLRRFGLEFANPIGLAAGFDKNGLAADALSALGFGFVEVGTVTNQPQSGNDKPRLFRLPQDQALVNRLGFNNCGAETLVKNIEQHRPECVLGINIGKSRNVPIEDAIPDYLATLETIHAAADYIAVNISSPNTPNLRALQQSKPLADLLSGLQRKNSELAMSKSPKPLLVKIAPDLNQAELESIIEVSLNAGVSGIIATNTTVARSGLKTSHDELKSLGEGGLSGAPLRQRSTEIISSIFQATRGRLPIVGVGGVFTAADAWEKISAGASLIQLYTGFIYEGPGVVKRINEGLVEIMDREGFKSLDDAIGCAVK